MPSNTTRLPRKSPCSARLSAARTTRTGVAVSHDKIHIRMKPKINAAIATIITATANWVSVRFRIESWKKATSAIPMAGIPEPTNQTIMVRPMMPDVSRRGGRPASSAWAATGRSANSVSR